MDQLVGLLGYEFVQNALAAGFVIAIVSGVVSGFVVARNMSFAVRARGRDVVVGVVMAFGLGLGVLFITLYKGYATQAFAILFGTITGVSRGDVLLLLAIGAVTLLALAAIYRPLVFATVDPEVAEARGVPVGALAVVFLLIMAAAVAEAIQVVGVLLILTLLITPGAAAERLTPRPGLAIACSVAIALLCTIGGILLSLVTNAPVSVFVTSLSFLSYLLARFAIGPRRTERRLASVPTEARSGPAPTASKTG